MVDSSKGVLSLDSHVSAGGENLSQGKSTCPVSSSFNSITNHCLLLPQEPVNSSRTLEDSFVDQRSSSFLFFFSFFFH